MVRIKHRYLLVHILYPESLALASKAANTLSASDPALPGLLQFRRPSPNDLTPQLLARTIKEQVALLYGDYGVGLISSSLNVKYLSPATSTAIIRCSRANYRLVWAALSFMTQLPKTSKHATPRSCAMQVVRVSGTIKKAEEEAIKRARAAILRAKRVSSEGSSDGLLRILSQAEEATVGQDQIGLAAGSDVSDDEEDENMDSEGND